jgi:hypothetical protein
LDIVSQAQLTAGQQQDLITSLSNSADGAAETPNVHISELLSQSSTNEVQEDVPDLATVLSVISQARLSARERHALAASLTNMPLPNQSIQADVTRGNTISSPPPYLG